MPDPRQRVQVFFDPESKVEKSHRQRVNINSIMAKINRGVMPPIKSGGLYGDFSTVEDFHTSVQRVQDANNDFLALPSEIRKKFHQNPAELIEFLNNPDNYEKAVEYGLIDRKDVSIEDVGGVDQTPPPAPTDPAGSVGDVS